MRRYGVLLAVATVLTGVVGLILKKVIERLAFPPNEPKAEIEKLFANLPLMAVSLACVGVFIIIVGLKQRRSTEPLREAVGAKESIWMGFFQGLCLPFRGFSRSGATISAGMALGVSKRPVEEFSFALGVILTPIVMAYELHRLAESHHGGVGSAIGLFLPGGGFFLPGLVGLVSSFIAGMLALRWLSSWLERGRWHFFGFYCLAASAVVLLLHFVSGY
jgi:undecaprenyl-diphosphatase